MNPLKRLKKIRFTQANLHWFDRVRLAKERKVLKLLSKLNPTEKVKALRKIMSDQLRSEKKPYMDAIKVNQMIDDVVNEGMSRRSFLEKTVMAAGAVAAGINPARGDTHPHTKAGYAINSYRGLEKFNWDFSDHEKLMLTYLMTRSFWGIGWKYDNVYGIFLEWINRYHTEGLDRATLTWAVCEDSSRPIDRVGSTEAVWENLRKIRSYNMPSKWDELFTAYASIRSGPSEIKRNYDILVRENIPHEYIPTLMIPTCSGGIGEVKAALNQVRSSNLPKEYEKEFTFLFASQGGERRIMKAYEEYNKGNYPKKDIPLITHTIRNEPRTKEIYNELRNRRAPEKHITTLAWIAAQSGKYDERVYMPMIFNS